jgi:hypothetical protein
MHIGLCFLLLAIPATQATTLPRYIPLPLHNLTSIWNISTAIQSDCMGLCNVTLEDEQMCEHTCELITESLDQVAESDWSDVDLSPFDFLNDDEEGSSSRNSTHQHPSGTAPIRAKRGLLKAMGKGAKGAVKLGKKVWPKITKFVNELWSMIKTYAVFEYAGQFVPSSDEGMCVIVGTQNPSDVARLV